MKKYSHLLVLILAIVSMALSNGKYLLAPAAFVFPFLFMVSFDVNHFKRSSLLLFLGLGLGNALSFHGMLPDVGIAFLSLLPFAAGALLAPAFILQMYAFKKSTSYVMALILPSLFTLMDFLNAQFNPFGGFGLLGYSQHGFLLFAQSASLVGALGLTFLIMYFASTGFWLLKKKRLHYLNPSLGLYLGIIILVLVFGAVRLAMPDGNHTVSISGIHTLDRTVDETASLFSDYANNPDRFIEASNKNLEKVLTMTALEASRGADIVSHAEATIVLSHKNKNQAVVKIKDTAVKENIMIVTTIYVLNPPPERNENVLLIIDESGETVLEHYKYGGNAFEGSIEGDKVIHAATTEFGKLSGIICWDKDFPSTVAQVGRLGVDTLFIPSADWKAISPYHSIVGTLFWVFTAYIISFFTF